MDLKFEFGELLKAEGLRKYRRDFQAQLLLATRRAMQEFGKEIRDKIRTDVSNTLKVRRQAILKSFVYKVYFRKTNKIPALHFYSGIKWMGVHAKGGSAGKVVIPLAFRKGTVKEGLGTIGFRKLLAQLASNKNLFFEKKGSITIIWARNTREDRRLLVNFRAYQRKQTGQKSIKKNERVNIGFITSVKWTKKLNMYDIVQLNMPKLSKEIEKQFKIVKNK
jgi:hypothetical protein